MRDLPYNVSIYVRAHNLRAYARKNYATVEIHLFLRFVFQMSVMWQYSREVPLSNVVLLCA